MQVGEFCTRDVVVAEHDTSARTLARLMRNEHVGDVIVVRRRGEVRIPIGIVTDRDLVLEVLAMDVQSDAVTAADLLTSKLVTAHEDDSVFATMQLMRNRGIRRLPVVDDDGALAGIFTLDDYIELLAEQLLDVVTLMVRQQVREEEQRPTE